MTAGVHAFCTEVLERAGPGDADAEREWHRPQEHGHHRAEHGVAGDPQQHRAEVGERRRRRRGALVHAPVVDALAGGQDAGRDPRDGLGGGEGDRGEGQQRGELSGEEPHPPRLAQQHRADGAAGELDRDHADEHDEQERAGERGRGAEDLGAATGAGQLLQRQPATGAGLGGRLGRGEDDGGATDARTR